MTQKQYQKAGELVSKIRQIDYEISNVHDSLSGMNFSLVEPTVLEQASSLILVELGSLRQKIMEEFNQL